MSDPHQIPAPSPADYLAPEKEVFSGFRLVARLGKFPAGEIWQAIRPDGVPVALRCIEISRPGARAEIRSLNLVLPIRHPNLVAYHGPWECNGWIAVGTNLADGSLLDHFERTRYTGKPGLPAAELIGPLGQAASGIDFLNQVRGGSRGQPAFALIHRDLTPASLVLFGDAVRVGNFGMTQPFEVDRGLKLLPVEAGRDAGLTAYSAPEIYRGRISLHSDQYSFAVIYCFLRSGQIPLIPNDRLDSVDLSMLPAPEHAAVERALALDPAKRWPSCTEFIKALEAAARPTVAIPTRTSFTAGNPFIVDLRLPEGDNLPTRRPAASRPQPLNLPPVAMSRGGDPLGVAPVESSPSGPDPLATEPNSAADLPPPVAAPEPSELATVEPEWQAAATAEVAPEHDVELADEPPQADLEAAASESESPVDRDSLPAPLSPLEVAAQSAEPPATDRVVSLQERQSSPPRGEQREDWADQDVGQPLAASRRDEATRRAALPIWGVAASIIAGLVWFGLDRQVLRPIPLQQDGSGGSSGPTIAQRPSIPSLANDADPNEAKTGQNGFDRDRPSGSIGTDAPATAPRLAAGARDEDRPTPPTPSPPPMVLPPPPTAGDFSPALAAQELVPPPAPAPTAPIPPSARINAPAPAAAEPSVPPTPAAVVRMPTARAATEAPVAVRQAESKHGRNAVGEIPLLRIHRPPPPSVAVANVEQPPERTAVAEHRPITPAAPPLPSPPVVVPAVEVPPERVAVADREPELPTAELIAVIKDLTRLARAELLIPAKSVWTTGQDWLQTHPLPPPQVAAAPAEAVGAKPTSPRTATILVQLPSERAELVVRGAVGRGNPDEWYGPTRTIHTPPLTDPQNYLIGTFWTGPDGRPATRSRSVEIKPGYQYRIDLRTDQTRSIEQVRAD